MITRRLTDKGDIWAQGWKKIKKPTSWTPKSFWGKKNKIIQSELDEGQQKSRPRGVYWSHRVLKATVRTLTSIISNMERLVDVEQRRDRIRLTILKKHF